MAIVATKCE